MSGRRSISVSTAGWSRRRSIRPCRIFSTKKDRCTKSRVILRAQNGGTTMRKTILILAMLVAVSAFAQQPAQAPQVKYPRLSQKASMTQTIGLTDMTITYSRPGVKGRQIWGALVPYDQVWRTGANEATVITFSDDVKINGQPL